MVVDFVVRRAIERFKGCDQEVHSSHGRKPGCVSQRSHIRMDYSGYLPEGWDR